MVSISHATVTHIYIAVTMFINKSCVFFFICVNRQNQQIKKTFNNQTDKSIKVKTDNHDYFYSLHILGLRLESLIKKE